MADSLISQILIDQDNFHFNISHLLVVNGKDIADSVRRTAVIAAVSSLKRASALVSVAENIFRRCHVPCTVNGLFQSRHDFIDPQDKVHFFMPEERACHSVSCAVHVEP